MSSLSCKKYTSLVVSIFISVTAICLLGTQKVNAENVGPNKSTINEGCTTYRCYHEGLGVVWARFKILNGSNHIRFPIDLGYRNLDAADGKIQYIDNCGVNGEFYALVNPGSSNTGPTHLIGRGITVGWWKSKGLHYLNHAEIAEMKYEGNSEIQLIEYIPSEQVETKVRDAYNRLSNERRQHPYKWDTTDSELQYFCVDSGIHVGTQSRADIPDRGFTTGDSEIDGGIIKSAGTAEPEEEVEITFTHYLVSKRLDTFSMPEDILNRILDQQINFQIFGENNTPGNPNPQHTIIRHCHDWDWNWKAEGYGRTNSTWHREDGSKCTEDGVNVSYEVLSSGLYSNTVKVKMPSEEQFKGTFKVCQTINYNPKEFKIDNSVAGAPQYSVSGAGSSTACVTFTPTPPPVPDPPLAEICPAGAYDHSANQGNTYAWVGVRNLSGATDISWKTTREGGNKATVYARPGDSVQFEHALCAGFPAVTGSDGFVGSGGRKFVVNQDSTNLGGQINRVNFQINGVISGSSGNSRNSSYAFGARPIVKNSPRVELDKFSISKSYTDISLPKSTNSAYNKKTNTNVLDADQLGNGSFLVYSPSMGEDNSHTKDYICKYADFAERHVAPGYQIPGFSRQNCTSAQKTRASDAGDIIAQELEWDNVRVWVSDRHYFSKTCESNPCPTPTPSPGTTDYTQGRVVNQENVSYGAGNRVGLWPPELLSSPCTTSQGGI